MVMKLKVNWKAIGIVATLLIMARVMLGAFEGEDMPLLVRAIVKAGTTAATLALIGLAIIIGLAAIDWLWRNYVKDIIQEPKTADVPPEMRNIASGIDNQLAVVEKWLGRVEDNGINALEQLQDVESHVTTAITLISTAMERHRITVRNCELLETAIRALAQNNPAIVCEVAGQVRDSGLSQLLFETTLNPDDVEFRVAVVKTISMQKGTLQGNADAYRQLGLVWLNRVSLLKAHATKLEAETFVIDAARPLALLNAHLGMAERFLNDNMLQPGMRQLPGVQTALLE
jgi:hypothetical protein